MRGDRGRGWGGGRFDPSARGALPQSTTPPLPPHPLSLCSNKSPKGESFERANRRKGRPAWRRSPDDTPLRDGNRDRLMGLVTARAVRDREREREKERGRIVGIPWIAFLV